MENPANRVWAAVLYILFGIAIGTVPGVIKMQQMRGEMDSTVASTGKQIGDLRAKIATLADQDQSQADAAAARGKYHTLLISTCGPVPHRNLIGIEDPWSHIDASFEPGTIWVIPGVVAPRTLNPDERAAWTIVDQYGHANRWLQGPVSTTVTERFPQ